MGGVGKAKAQLEAQSCREYQRQQELLTLQQYKDEQGKCGFVFKTGQLADILAAPSSTMCERCQTLTKCYQRKWKMPWKGTYNIKT